MAITYKVTASLIMDINLLKKFYQGKCNNEEKAKILHWLNTEGQDSDFMQQLDDAWEDHVDSFESHNSHSILENIEARIYADEQDKTRSLKQKETSIINRVLQKSFRIAAILFIGLGIGWGSFSLYSGLNPKPLQQNIVEKDVGEGQKLTVKLSDGSKVTLNSGSRLTYLENFSENKREVLLDGEAFFEVAPDTSRPFTISAQDFKITVLGTSFNVNAYEGDSIMSVAVATGLVKVNKSADQNYFLTPGKEFEYQPKLDQIKINEFDKMMKLAWKEGILYFEDASLQEVEKRLERWYGVEIIIEKDYKGSWLYSGVFENQSLENVLESMSYVQKFNYSIDGQRITIFNKEK